MEMTLDEVREILECEVVVGGDQLRTVVSTVCGADLMSDVLAFATPGTLLLTGLTNFQSVQTADIVDVKAIVYVRGKKPDEEAIRLAQENGIPILSTNLLMFEACGRLYVRGLASGGEVKRS